MNRFIIYSFETDKSCALIKDPIRIAHLRDHLKVELNQELKVVVPGRGLARGRIKKINPWNEVHFDLKDFRAGEERWIDLYIGLCRPPSAKKIIEHGVGLPIRSITFFKADLSDKSYLTSKVFKEGFTKKLLDDGLSQAGFYHDTPQVKLATGPVQSLEIKNNDFSYFLDLNEKLYFSRLLEDKALPLGLSLYIGPERGWSKREIDWFRESGFQGVAISKGIQRVELATFVALGQLEMVSFDKN